MTWPPESTPRLGLAGGALSSPKRRGLTRGEEYLGWLGSLRSGPQPRALAPRRGSAADAEAEASASSAARVPPPRRGGGIHASASSSTTGSAALAVTPKARFQASTATLLGSAPSPLSAPPTASLEQRCRERAESELDCRFYFAPMAEETNGKEEEEFSTGPLSVLMMSVKYNTQEKEVDESRANVDQLKETLLLEQRRRERAESELSKLQYIEAKSHNLELELASCKVLLSSKMSVSYGNVPQKRVQTLSNVNEAGEVTSEWKELEVPVESANHKERAENTTREVKRLEPLLAVGSEERDRLQKKRTMLSKQNPASLKDMLSVLSGMEKIIRELEHTIDELNEIICHQRAECIRVNERLCTEVGKVKPLEQEREQLHLQVASLESKVERAFSECSNFGQNKEFICELEQRLSDIEKELCTVKVAAAAKEKHLSDELSVVTKLADLHKEIATECSAKAGELEGVIEAMEIHLTEVKGAYKIKLEKETLTRENCEKEAAKLKQKLEKCKFDLENARKSSEPTIADAANVSGPTLAAALLHDSWSLPKMYAKYKETVQSLVDETRERYYAETALKRVSCENKELEKYKVEAEASMKYMIQYKEIADSNETVMKQLEASHQNFKAEAEVAKKALEDEIAMLKDKLLDLENIHVMKCEEAASTYEFQETPAQNLKIGLISVKNALDEHEQSTPSKLEYKEIANSNETTTKQLEASHQNFKAEAEVPRKALEDEIAILKDKLLDLENIYVMKCEDAAGTYEFQETVIDNLKIELASVKNELDELRQSTQNELKDEEIEKILSDWVNSGSIPTIPVLDGYSFHPEDLLTSAVKGTRIYCVKHPLLKNGQIKRSYGKDRGRWWLSSHSKPLKLRKGHYQFIHGKTKIKESTSLICMDEFTLLDGPQTFALIRVTWDREDLLLPLPPCLL